jgi:hypothetical protein
MGNEKKTPIDIDGKPYYFEDMTEKQQLLVNHLVDLDRKLSSARFNVDQLQVGRDAFMSMLKAELDAEQAQAETETAQQEAPAE